MHTAMIGPDWPEAFTGTINGLAASDIALVAEAPASEEEAAGRVLVGASGRVLNQLLQVAGIERRACYVGNAFRQRLPADELAEVLTDKASAGEGAIHVVGEKWLPGAWAAQIELLFEDLRALRPRVIVALGSVATWALLRRGVKMDLARGIPVPADHIFPGARVLTTYQPAHLFHSWKLFATLAADLAKAKRLVRVEGLGYRRRRLVIEPSMADLIAFQDKVEAAYQKGDGLMAVDIETSPAYRQITMVGFGFNAEDALSIPFVHNGRPGRSYWSTAAEEIEAWQVVEKLCRHPIPKLLQNGLYDIYWLWTLMRIPVMAYRHDTRLMHHAIFPELPKSLAFMGSAYADTPAWKSFKGEWTDGEKRDD